MPSPRRLAAVAVLAVAALFGAAAQAAEAHPVALSVSPSSLPAGATRTVTATVTNQASDKTIRSLELVPPPGYAVTGPLKFLHLEIPPYTSRSFPLQTTAACSPSGPAAWNVKAKTTPDLSGSDVFGPVSGARSTAVTGTCTLAFTEQPARTLAGAVIGANGDFTAGPPFPSVVFRDGAGGGVPGRTVKVALGLSAGPGTLSGPTTAVTASSGVASFPGLKISAAGTYRLSASSTGTPPAVVASDPFSVQERALQCGSGACATSFTEGSTRVDAALDPGAPGYLSVALNPNTQASTPSCIGYTSVGDRWAVVLGPTGGSRTKSAILTVAKPDWHATSDNGVAHLNVCYGAPRPAGFDPADPSTWGFGIAPGTEVKPWDADGDGVKESLQWVPETCAGKQARRPCVADRRGVKGGGAQITVLMPGTGDDPAMRP